MRTHPPTSADTPALAALRAGLAPQRISDTWPVIGELEGDTVPVTFAYSAAQGREVMVHLNGITDTLRRDFSWARLPEVSQSPWSSTYAAAWHLPAGLLCGYRIVDVEHLPPEAGHSRAGWLAIHRAGKPDPLGTETMSTPLGGACTLLALPGAHRHPAWNPETPILAPGPEVTRLTDRVSAWDWGHHRRTVLLFDAEQWLAVGLLERLRTLSKPPLVLAVDSGNSIDRSTFLPYPERVSAAVRQAINALREHSGLFLTPDELLATGQSYGGLAAVGMLVEGHVSAAFAQSPSLHFREGAVQPPGLAVGTGDLMTRVTTDLREGRQLSGRLEMVAGTEEPGMLDVAQASAPVLERAGFEVQVRRVIGGHDYAWWRHELMFAIERHISSIG